MGRVYSRRRKTKSKKRDFITEDTERQRGAKKQGRHGRRPDISEGAPKVRKNQYVARRCVIAKLGPQRAAPYGFDSRAQEKPGRFNRDDRRKKLTGGKMLR